jgi:hypothetical protein
MIDSFHFIALTTMDQLILIGGMSFAINWENQSLQGSLFAHNIFLKIKETILSKPRQ